MQGRGEQGWPDGGLPAAAVASEAVRGREQLTEGTPTSCIPYVEKAKEAFGRRMLDHQDFILEEAEPVVHGVQAERAEGAEQKAKSGESAEVEREAAEEEEEEEFTEVDLAVAIMLLGAVSFVMALFSLVHHPDPDMKYYAWQVINKTLAIFVAYLVFQGVDKALHDALTALGHSSHQAHLGLDLAEMLTFYLVLQVIVAVISGVLEQTPYGKDGRLIGEQVHAREGQMKCWAALVSHMAAFSAINFGCALQRLPIFLAHPPLTFAVAVAMLLLQLLLGYVTNAFRETFLAERQQGEQRRRLKAWGYVPVHHDFHDAEGKVHVTKENGKAYALHSWDEELEEAENEIAALSFSYLTVEACKFNICGHLHVLQQAQTSFGFSLTLMLTAASFAVALVLNVLASDCLAKEVGGPDRAVMKRVVLVAQSGAAMSLSWTVLAVATWELTRNVPQLGGPESAAFRVLLALGMSFGAFLLISGLDKLADSPLTGQAVDLTIFSIIEAISILVGFSWEQSFHLGVEVIAKAVRQPLWGQLVLAVLVAMVVIVPWKRYILEKKLELQRDREAREAREAQKELKAHQQVPLPLPAVAQGKSAVPGRSRFCSPSELLQKMGHPRAGAGT